MRRTLPLLIALAACAAPRVAPPAPPIAEAAASDPPVRPIAELPFVRQDGLDEVALFEAIRAHYVASGFPDAARIELALDEYVLVPFSGGTHIASPHFLGSGPAVRDHLATVSRVLYGGRLDGHATPDVAYHAFMATLIAHEIAHSLASFRRDLDFQNMWAEETRAIEFERAVLSDLVRAGTFPASWPAAFDRFNAILLAAAPDGLVAGLPTEREARRAAFDQAYPEVAAGMGVAIAKGHPHPAKVDLVLALYSIVRLELARTPAPTLASLVPRLASPPPAEEATP